MTTNATLFRHALILVSTVACLVGTPEVAAQTVPTLQGEASRKLHGGGAGTFDLPLVLPDPNAGWVTLISRSWTVAGGLEAYLCRGEVAAQDLYITSFRAPTVPGLARVVVTISDTVQTLGDFACNGSDGLFGNSKLIYWAGPGVNDILFPAGKGVEVKAGQYVLINTQVDNTSGVTLLSGTSQLLMKTGTAAQVTTPVEQILVGTFLFNIPANSTHSTMGGCSSANNQTLLTVAPGMRQLGTHQLVQVIAGAATTLLDTNFNVSQQLSYPLLPAANVLTGNQIRTTCTWTNPTGSSVTFGDSVQSELCFTAVYRYPVVPGNVILSCVN